MTRDDLLTNAFRSFSARLGRDPLQVQGPGGNTSIKADGVMWIKASGTKLADAETSQIFVAVDHTAALAEAHGAGDGSCKNTILDPKATLRPSIETTFHAALDWPVVAHTHSVATLVHAISPEGRLAAHEKLADLPHILVTYEKPGRSLTREILARIHNDTRVVILENHGLICCGETVAETADLIAEVEKRLSLPPTEHRTTVPELLPEPGYVWAREGWLAQAERATEIALAGSYYPDHVVFLGPALPAKIHDGDPPAVLKPGFGVMLKSDATQSQKDMLRCLCDVLQRLPEDWSAAPIGEAAEAALLNWDAEKYRQALAARS